MTTATALSSEQSVWGIDASTRGVALGVAYEDRAVCETVEFPYKLRGPERLARIAALTREAVPQWAQRYEPLLVFVEQPSGKFTSLELVYATGIVAMCIYESLNDLYEYPVSVLWVPSATWKMHGVNNGAAKKEQIRRWAEQQGYDFTTQDEADALGIAVGGRRMVEKGEQTKLVV